MKDKNSFGVFEVSKQDKNSFGVFEVSKPVEITFKTDTEPILKTMDCFD